MLYGGNRFGQYIESLREKQGITAEQLAEGLCTRSMITKIESGDKSSTKLLRDRFIERLGASTEHYESFVSIDEYQRWIERRKIIISMEKKDYASASLQIEEYLARSTDKLDDQFGWDMKTIIAKKTDDPFYAEYLEKALRLTVNVGRDGQILTTMLAPKEINLLMEYAILSQDGICDKIFNHLLEYVKTRTIDDDTLVMFYPKLVYLYIARNIDAIVKEELDTLLDKLALVLAALGLLKRTHKLYNISDLLVLEKTLLTHVGGKNIITSLEGDISDIEGQIDLLNGFAKTYGIDYSTESWSYLYIEQGVHCVGEVIRRRRRMLKMSQEDLAEGICSTKTLDRTERLLTSPHLTTLQLLFERLRMPGEYQRSYFAIGDIQMMRQVDRILTLIDQHLNEEAENEIKKLKDSSSKDDYLQQFILMVEAIISYRNKQITKSECIESFDKILRKTVSPEGIDCSHTYFTATELTLIYYVVMLDSKMEKNIYIESLEKFFNDQYNDLIGRDARKLATVSLAKISVLSRREKYEEALNICEMITVLELENKRTYALEGILAGKNQILWLMSEKKQLGSDIVKKNALIFDRVRKYMCSP